MKVLLNRFYLNGHTLWFHNNLVKHNKQYHMEVLRDSFHMNARTLGFRPQTQRFIGEKNIL